MKVYIVVEYFAYEGFDTPDYVFDSLEKAEAQRDKLLAQWSDRDIRIIDLEVQ